MKPVNPDTAHTCTTCGRIHYVPSLARDCENSHKKDRARTWNK